MTDRIFLDGIDNDVQATLDRLVERLEVKTRRNLLRASYYDGKRAIRQVGTVIPPHYFRLGIVLGWSAKAVDALARRCNLDGFVWPDGDIGGLGLADVWEGNNLDAEIPQALVSSLVHATAFVVTTRGGDGEPPALIHFKDALSATGEWDPRRRRLSSMLSITERDKDGNPSSIALYLDGVTIVADKDAGRWEWSGQEHPWGVPADPLVYKPRLGRMFGSSRISRPVMSLQDQATRAVIRLEGHMDVYSWPELWMLGADESIFKNEDGSPKASWQVMLGRIKGIPDDHEAPLGQERADVKQFPASSPKPHLDQLNALAKMFARETSLPDASLAISDMANPTSAEAYTASQVDLIAEAEGAMDGWSQPLRRAVVRALAIQEGLDEIPDQWRTVAPKWRSPMYLSRAQQADAGAKQLGSVPWLAETEVGLELLGLDSQQIARALADRRRSQGTAALTSILERVAGDADTAA